MLDLLTIAGLVGVHLFTAAGLVALFWPDITAARSPWRL